MNLTAALCMAVASLGVSKSARNTACNHMGYIVEQSKKNNVEPSLIVSMMYVESGFQKKVVSKAGACGLMQLIPKWNYLVVNGKKRYYTCERLKRDTRLNIKLGVLALKKWMKIVKADDPENLKSDILNRSICAYNAGNRCRWKKRIKNPAKTKYAKRVLATQEKIHKAMRVAHKK